MADRSDKPLACPFRIWIDSAEQHPFTFQGLRADSDHSYRPLVIETEFRSLGRHPHSLGDYCPSTGFGRCHIERKSRQDCEGTILGFGEGERRERFESELANLAAIEAGCVIVECSLDELLMNVQPHGRKTASQLAKSLFRSIIAYQQDYRGCAWLFCDGRRLAEQAAFRWMERWHRKFVAQQRAAGIEQGAIYTQQPLAIPGAISADIAAL